MNSIKNQVKDREIRIGTDATASVHEDGIVILHIRKGCLFSSNRTGAWIWRCIEERLPFEAIAEKLSSEYQIARTIARKHATRFLLELESHSLIEWGVES